VFSDTVTVVLAPAARLPPDELTPSQELPGEALQLRVPSPAFVMVSAWGAGVAPSWLVNVIAPADTPRTGGFFGPVESVPVLQPVIRTSARASMYRGDGRRRMMMAFSGVSVRL